jgi:2-polyprenyl-6-methoxyphenol hydroxylase-like FAD-dependent oxidoreductase
MEHPNFKVIIVGGSVSGLTLANMLEKLNIDYVVLESYKTIAPQVGASIGLQANGLRILDQLGCADTLVDLVDTPLHSQILRDSKRLSNSRAGLGSLENGMQEALCVKHDSACSAEWNRFMNLIC